jgi:hypothetical protein
MKIGLSTKAVYFLFFVTTTLIFIVGGASAVVSVISGNIVVFLNLLYQKFQNDLL